MKIKMKWLLSLIIFVFSLADVSSQTVTNAFWGVTWGMKDLDAFYVLKEQQLSPEFQQIGNETLVIINNVSFINSFPKFPTIATIYITNAISIFIVLFFIF